MLQQPLPVRGAFYSAEDLRSDDPNEAATAIVDVGDDVGDDVGAEFDDALEEVGEWGVTDGAAGVGIHPDADAGAMVMLGGEVEPGGEGNAGGDAAADADGGDTDDESIGYDEGELTWQALVDVVAGAGARAQGPGNLTARGSVQDKSST